MLKLLALAVYTFMAMMLYESFKYQTHHKRRKQAKAILILIILVIMTIMGRYLLH